MTIIELLESVGIENVRVQYLHETATGATYKQKQRLTEFKFLSAQGQVNDLMPNPTNIAMIVWMPRDKFEEACNFHKNKHASELQEALEGK